MFYYTYLMLKKNNNRNVDEYYQIFIYGVIFYVFFYIILHTDMIHDNFFNVFLREYILYIMVLDGGFLIFDYINVKQMGEKKNTKEIEIESETDILSEKLDLDSDVESEKDIKISHQSSDSVSVLVSDIAI